MNLMKCGILGLVAACAAVAACGGSSSDDSASKAGSGNSTSSGGSSSSTAGSTSSSSGGKTSGGGGSSVGTAGKSGTAGAGTGTAGAGTCTTGSTDPTGMADQCPDLTTCAESSCKDQFDACSSATGVCADYQKCVTACNCDATCASACPQSDACTTCASTAVNCLTSKCSTQFNACIGGALGDAGTGKTCKDLSACCKTLPADQQMSCTMTASQGIDFICDAAYGFICMSN